MDNNTQKCDCRAKLQDVNKWTLNTKKGKEKAIRATIDTGIIESNGTLEAVTTSRIEVSFASRKQPLIDSIPHNYCPWCGTKY